MKLEINIGDIIYTGKFKNKKQEVKTFGKDDKGQPTINGKKVLTFRMEKFFPKKEQLTTEEKLRKIIKEELKRLVEEENDEINELVEFIKKLINDPRIETKNYNSPTGSVITLYKKHSENSYDIEKLTKGGIRLLFLNKKIISTNSLADLTKNYQTTSAYNFKTKKIKLDKFYENVKIEKIKSDITKYFDKLKEQGIPVV